MSILPHTEMRGGWGFIVDGLILKRGDKLTAAQPADVAREARIALAAVRKRANWR